MWKRVTTCAIATILSLSGPGSTAEAGDWRVSLSKRSRHGSVGIELGSNHGRHHGHEAHRRPYRYPRRTHGAKSVWVPGHHETSQQRVWVPATWREEYVPPVHETRYDECGVPYQVQIRPGYTRRIKVAGHYERRPVQVWRPGHWEVARY